MKKLLIAFALLIPAISQASTLKYTFRIINKCNYSLNNGSFKGTSFKNSSIQGYVPKTVKAHQTLSGEFLGMGNWAHLSARFLYGFRDGGYIFSPNGRIIGSTFIKEGNDFIAC